MKTNPSKHGLLAVNSSRITLLIHKRKRVKELTAIKGHPTREVSKSDRKHAKRELTRDLDTEWNATAHVPVSESEGWSPSSGPTGYRVHVPSGDDEDDEGRSDTERLVEEGAREAGRDRVLQATRETNNR